MEPLSILVVDDSATMRSMIQRIIRISGLPVENFYEAGNGQEALAILKENRVDLMLVDLNMPVMNGMELIQAVRGKIEFAEMPIVVVSTESSATRIADLAALGLGFVHKPFTPEQVRQVILKALGGEDHEAH